MITSAKYFFPLLLGFILMPSQPGVSQIRPIETPPGYDHDHFGTEPRDIFREFGGFVVSFDSDDDNDGDGIPDKWAIPEWVSHEIQKFEALGNSTCIPTADRPTKWFTERGLYSSGIAPDDSSYQFSSSWRTIHKNWYVRGHLAMKFLVERIGNDAAWNTHTVLNAVPQRDEFNSGIWQDLEDLTGAWGQRYGKVWVITGPVIIDRAPSGFIGDEGEVPVAIPDSLFKIVVREGEGSETPEVLAFMYPQWGPGYNEKKGQYPHEFYLTSVDSIEEITGLDFFTNVPKVIEEAIEEKKADTLWLVGAEDFIRACRK